MADAINRIVPSSVAVERAGWKEKEGRKQKNNDANARAQSPDRAKADSNNGAEPAADESPRGKGRHLDISAFIDGQWKN